MATSSKENTSNTIHNVQGQPTKSRSKTRNLSRPVVSTMDPREHYRRTDPIQGPGLREKLVMDERSEVQRLENEVKRLRENLSAAESTIKRLMKRDREMTERLSEHMQRHVKQSGKFENLSQVTGLRLHHLIEKYELLYSQGRLDALDELDEIAQLSKMKKREDIKHKIMAGIIIASYRICSDYTNLIRESVMKLLGIQPRLSTAVADPADSEVESSINSYLQSTTEKYNIEQIVKDVEDQLREILPEFPDFLTTKPHMASYICECVRLNWALVNQTSPIEIEYTSERFSSVMHNRFHTSDARSPWIKLYVWPTLVNSKDKNVLSKGIVIT